MNDTTVGEIRTFSLEARDLLEQEISEQLEGLYGWLPKGNFADPQPYPALAQLEEARKTREYLQQWLADEVATGLSARNARAQLVREAAYTWLNRLAAFRMMETRGLIRETVARGADSNGFKRWLAADGNEDWLEKYEAGDMPQTALGEGPRQEAYRHYILHQCAERANEIKVLFDPDTLVSRLFPRPPTLSELFELMNAVDLQDAWAPENDETIGWIYQFFNSEELEKAFAAVATQGKKFETRDIPSVTQLFTPRWIVRFLVENTLGRLWMDMHPHSSVQNQFEYIVPLDRRCSVPLKSVREITFLDPACGTMHFGLVAFDLFVAMYEEELANAGSEGWPKEACVDDPSEIPASIIANNLFGADIDLRAVQLSALTLYLKAKSLNKDAEITESNLACANAHLLNGDHMKAFIKQTGLERPIYRRVLEELQVQLQQSEQLGTLLRLEEAIPSLIEKERQWYLSEGLQTELPGFGSKQMELEVGRQEFWEMLEAQIEQALNLFVSESGQEQRFFAGEAQKGLRLLDIVSRRYDVVATNPPYMSVRKMNATLKKLVADRYPEGKQDLYAAFLLRCNELAEAHGRVGMLTMHSYMFISSYEKMRTWFRERIALDTVAHCGPALFAVGNPGTLQTVAAVFRREPDEGKRDDSVGTYFRLVKEPDGESKRLRFEEANARLRAGGSDPVVYQYRQADFDDIPGSPWVYWVSRPIVDLFEKCPSLREICPPRHGLSTCNNFRYLRRWWEIGTGKVVHGCKSCADALLTGGRWFPYMKGGGFQRWYGNQEFAVNWQDDGAEIKADIVERFPYLKGNWGLVVTNPDTYFGTGVTWSDLSSGRFAARLSPGGFIYDVKGSSAFPEDPLLVLAVLNAPLTDAILSMLNPTVSFQVGDLSRIPMPSHCSAQLRQQVKEVIEEARKDALSSEITYEFIRPVFCQRPDDPLNADELLVYQLQQSINEELLVAYGLSKTDLRGIELVEEVVPVAVSQEPPGGSHADSKKVGASFEKSSKEWISYAFGITIGRFQPGVEGALGRGDFSDDVNNRLQPLADPDGIMVMDAGHSDDVVRKVLDCLNAMLGPHDTAEVVHVATGKTGDTEDLLRTYFEKQFFKDHIKLYRKRPVYWLLQSPGKRYGIWIFHERFTHDTLFRINEIYIQPKINLLENRIRELLAANASASGPQVRKNEKELSQLNDVLDDVKEFQRLVKAITDRGYTPHIDDGVLINMAPLWQIVPSWQAEPKKAWQKLEDGDWDWSYQAMDHWPDRVRGKCKTNKSYAIAHGLEELYEG